MSENSKPTADALDAATRALRDAPVPPGPPDDLTAATVAAIENRLAGAVPAEHARREQRRRFMRYAGFGTAAATAAAVGVILWSPGRSPAGMFDRAMENADKADSMRAWVTSTAGGMRIETKLYTRGEDVRSEMDLGKDLGGSVLVVDGRRKKGLELSTADKKARWLDFSKEDDGKVEAAVKDATGIGELFSDLKGKAVRRLPDETVDGRRLTVYAVRGHKLEGSKGEADVMVWIDPKTELPARCRVEMTVDKVKAVSDMEVLGWNEELDETLFELKVPEGYTVVKD